jgi:hypothetical protein
MKMAKRDNPPVEYAGRQPDPVEEAYPDPQILDDPDRSGREGPAATDPGIQTTGDEILCPWCGARQDLFLEPSGQSSVEEFVEECAECCRDFEVRVEYDPDGTPHVSTRRSEGG